jgi:class 3 adenylate cyclase/predicted ATPase
MDFVRAESVGSAPSADRLLMPGGERRQLTVMFYDLVGSTTFAARHDPEDLQEAMAGYHRCVGEAICHHGGYVATYMGDGALVYFGYPHAHEDDAERAIRAGLAAIEAASKLTFFGQLPQTRIGIATGVVVVGSTGGASGSEDDIIGETPNLAARLQSLAEPNSVVIASSTRRLVGDLFEYGDLGLVNARGFDEPVPAWRVIGPRPAPSRFEAVQRVTLTELTGRDEELAILLDRWERARSGEGQIILLQGAPGIGKSRVARELRIRVGAQEHRAIRYQCLPRFTNTALYPIVHHIEQEAGFLHGDTNNVKFEKLKRLFPAQSIGSPETLPVLAEMLSIPTDGRFPPLALTPAERKRRMIRVFDDQLTWLAAQGAVLIILEDAHWIDPTTLDLLDHLVKRARELRVLLLVTARPEFLPTWEYSPHLTILALAHLAPHEAMKMVERVARWKSFPREVMEYIVTRADGVPLFIEELTKALLESGVLQEGRDEYALSEPLPMFTIPSTLQDSLNARLDRLGPIKEIAQIGATIGRTFSYVLLSAVSPLKEGKLDAAIGRLVASELVISRGTPPDATYTFKHALIQDAAYSSLLKVKRQKLHSSIARALEENFPDVVEITPELLAQHYTDAGLKESAIGYWRKAGRRSAERSANQEAIAQLTRGLSLVEELPPSHSRTQMELALCIELVGPLIALKGYSSPEFETIVNRARILAREVGHTPQLFPALYGRQMFLSASARIDEAHELAVEILRLAAGQQSDWPYMIGHRLVGSSLLMRGNSRSALTHLEKSVALYNPEQHRSLMRWGSDVRVSTLSFLTLGYWHLGYADRALVSRQTALELAEASAHANTQGYALTLTGILDGLLDRIVPLRHAAEKLLSLALVHDLPVWEGAGRFYLGCALAGGTETERGVTAMEEGLAKIAAAHILAFQPMYLAWYARCCSRINRRNEALTAIDRARAIIKRGGERWLEPEIERIRGEILLNASAADALEAETCFTRGLGLAREQGSKTQELRTAINLARLWRKRGEIAEADSLLRPIFSWFTEGFETHDLIEAKWLLFPGRATGEGNCEKREEATQRVLQDDRQWHQ